MTTFKDTFLETTNRSIIIR